MSAMTTEVACMQRKTPVVVANQSSPHPYNLSIGYLRGFVTLMVVAHHAVLAYHSDAPMPPVSLLTKPRWWQAFPVVDSAAHWSGFSIFVGFNDIFFMSLMFFISGLFVWQSIQRKGIEAFLRDRLLRLGLPFAVAAAVIAPIAYYPAYLQTGGHGISGYWRVWRSLGNWPAGPAWFIWVLLAFDCIAAGLFSLMPRALDFVGCLSLRGNRQPFAFYAFLTGVSAVAYVSVVHYVNAFDWSSFGPFTFQTARVLHYLVYFLIGAGAGAAGIERGLLAPDGKLSRRWLLWSIAAVVVFVLEGIAFVAAVTPSHAQPVWGMVANVGFAVSCAASSFAFLAVFLRFAKTRVRLFDSVTANAYGIYLIHYAFVSWLQYALLRAHLPAIAKGSTVFLVAALLSWGAIAALRKVPAIARVV